MQYFHVPVSGAEQLKTSAAKRIAHLLCQVSVFDVLRPEPSSPVKRSSTSPLPGPGFKIQNLRLTVSEDKRIVNLDLGDELVLHRHDQLVNEASDPLEQRRHHLKYRP